MSKRKPKRSLPRRQRNVKSHVAQGKPSHSKETTVPEECTLLRWTGNGFELTRLTAEEAARLNTVKGD